MNWNEVRAQFPACEKYTYLNPAGGSPVSKAVYAAASGFYKEMLEEGDTLYETWLEKTEKTRERLASFVGASAKEIAFTMNTSHGMNLVASMFGPGDEVLAMDDEFPSSTIPWLNRGNPVRFVKPVRHVYASDAIEKTIRSGTKILVSSLVQYNTGFKQDLGMLQEICKKHGLYLVVNATQGIGAIPLDLSSYDVDFMMFTGLKWPMAGYGVGGIYVNQKHLGHLPYGQAGWQSVKEPEAMDNKQLDLPAEAAVLEPGVPHFANIFALGAAIGLLDNIGKERIYQRIMDLNAHLEKRLQETGIEIITPLQPAYRSGITVIKMPNAKEVVNRLAEKNIIVSARGEGIRVSLHVYNNEEDIDRLVGFLKKKG